MNESSVELEKLVTAEVGIQILMIQLKKAMTGGKHGAISISLSLQLPSYCCGCNYIRHTIL